jgi:hypothetical protein
MSQQILVQALGLVIDRLGQPVKGGKEIFVSDQSLRAMSKDAQVQVERHPVKPGYSIRYFPNETLNIEASRADDDGFAQAPQAEDKTPI